MRGKRTTLIPQAQLRLRTRARRGGAPSRQPSGDAEEERQQTVTDDERLKAVEALGRLCLPVGSPERMAEESLPAPRDLLP